MSDGETDFDLLEGPDGRMFLKLFTGQCNYMLQIDEDEIDELRDRLDEPPTLFE